MASLSGKTFTLNDGTKIPAVGMGAYIGAPGGGQRVFDMCLKALKGYRHFDTAASYAWSLYSNHRLQALTKFSIPGTAEDEEEVGKALSASDVPRSNVNEYSCDSHGRVHEAFEESLAKLGLDYIDLYLLHFSQAISNGVTLQPEESPTYVETYLEMEKLLATGKVKTIGVSNLSIKTLPYLLEKCTVVPAINQVELHPALPQNELKEYCESKRILLTAYSPLGLQKMLEDSTVQSISQRLGITPAQVLLSWGVQRGTIVIPQTEN